MIGFIHALLSTIAYVAITLGAYLLCSPMLRLLWTSIRVESEHKKRLFKAIRSEKTNQYLAPIHQFNHYIEHLLRNTKKKYKTHHLHQFWFLFIGLGLLIGFFLYQWSSSVSYGLWSGIFISISYLLHHVIKLRNIRIKAGYDLVGAVGILNVRYKTERMNMELALIEASKEVPSPLFRAHFLNIVKARKNGTMEDVEQALSEFQFVVHTKFAHHLSIIIQKSLDSKENIESTLMALDQNLLRNVNTLKAESSTQAELLQFKWFHMVAFPITIIALIQWLGWDSWVTYQFGSTSAQLLFLFSSFSIIMVFFLANWFRDTPNDY